MMAIKPVSGEIKSQDINDNLSYLDSEKRNISDNIEFLDLGNSVKEAMTGGSIPYVGPSSVDSISLKKEAVTESKTNFFDLNKNLFDVESRDIILNKGFSGVTSNIVDNAPTDITGWIDISGGQKILISINGNSLSNPEFYKIAFYKNKGEWLSTYSYDLKGITAPSNAYLMRVQYKNSDKIFLQIEYNTITSYKAYKTPVLKNDKIALSSVGPMQTTFFIQGNLLNIDSPDILKNKGFSLTSNTIIDSSLHNISHKINFTGGDKIVLSTNEIEVPANGHYKIAFYNEENWLATIMYAVGGVTVPTGVTSYRVQYDNKVSNIQVEIDKITSYKPFLMNPVIDPKFLPNNKNNLVEKNFTSFGDSLTYRNMWQPYIVEKTGMNHTNLGIGSTTVALIESLEHEYPSMCNATRLQAVIDSDPFLLTINGGTNDKHRNVSIGENTEFGKILSKKDKTTYKGALSYIIESLLMWKNELNIILITPPQADKTKWNFDYEPYGIAMSEVANYYGLYIADWYHNSGVNKVNINNFTTDGLHQNINGGKRAANIVYEQVRKIQFF